MCAVGADKLHLYVRKHEIRWILFWLDETSESEEEFEIFWKRGGEAKDKQTVRRLKRYGMADDFNFKQCCSDILFTNDASNFCIHQKYLFALKH